ncbi:Transient receptor potential cation channel subfamily V member 2, partial [Eschrichtius robustus]|nr:Transient receptor potential cation channel subfamily V member 2 [Eschrichtius robustus]
MYSLNAPLALAFPSQHRHRMVVLEPLNKLLQAKWNLLIPRFLFNFLCYLTYVSIFTALSRGMGPQPRCQRAAAGRGPQARPECVSVQDFLPLEVTAGNSVLLLGHILILVVGANILMGQLWYFWRRRLFIWISFMDSYFEILLYVWPHSSSPVSCLGGGTRLALGALLAVLSQVLCFLAIEWYLPLHVCSLALGWVNLLYYMRGLQHTGIYSVMIQKVILRDLLRFLLVYLVFLFGFAVGKGPPCPTHSLPRLEAARWSPQAEDPLPLSSALVSLSREAQDPGAPAGSNSTEAAGEGDKEGSTAPYEGILDAALELFKFTVGMGELAFQDRLRFRGAVLLLLLAYVLLTYVLLLNMLIALMNETVSSVASDSWSIWKLQKAISVLEMENGYWWCRRKKQRAGVRLTVGTRPDGHPDERWCFRVEEVNWAAWEQTLPTVREEPAGPGGPEEEEEERKRKQSAQDEDAVSLCSLDISTAIME